MIFFLRGSPRDCGLYVHFGWDYGVCSVYQPVGGFLGCCLGSDPIGLEDSVQLLCPVSLGTLQALLQHVHHGLICGFCLPVRLGVSRRSKGESDAPVFVELLEIVALKLGAVVSDDFFWNPETRDYVRPYELSDLEIGYSAECFCLDPFQKVICYYQEEDLLPRRHGELSYYIHAPFPEWPGRAYGLEVLRRQSGDRGVPLASVTMFSFLVGIIGHRGPVIACSFGSRY